MNVASRILSPLARRALRALAPLALLACISLGVVAGVLLLVREPAQDRLRNAEAAYGAARQAQSEQLAVRRTEEALAATWQSLPARKEFPSLILAVTDLAQRDGVAIPGISYSLQKVDEGVAMKASMAFQVAGDYAAIRRFIHRLETDRHYLAVESLDASRSQKRLSLGQGRESVIEQVRFNIRVMTFLKPDTPAPLRAA
jgi:Tfp pilus assembly protein PilO